MNAYTEAHIDGGVNKWDLVLWVVKESVQILVCHLSGGTKGGVSSPGPGRQEFDLQEVPGLRSGQLHLLAPAKGRSSLASRVKGGHQEETL